MTVGIVGGLGPLAGAAFYCRLVSRTPAGTDDEHLGVILLSDPTLPSRADHLLGTGPSPLPGLTGMIRQLDSLGATIIAIPSATTHAYFDRLRPHCRGEMVNLLQEVAETVTAGRIRRLGLLTTRATRQLGLYQRHLPSTCHVATPDPASQEDLDAIIAAVKAGPILDELALRLSALLARPWATSCDAILLGCTELHLLASRLDHSTVLIDSTDILVDAVLRAAGSIPRNALSASGSNR